MRNFISNLFGFTSEICGLKDIIAIKEARVSELEVELSFYRNRIFEDYKVVTPVSTVSTINSNSPKPVKGSLNWKRVRSKLESMPAKDPVKAVEEEIETVREERQSS